MCYRLKYQIHTTIAQAIMKQKWRGRKYMCALWHRMRLRMKPRRKKKRLIVLSYYLGTLDSQNSLAKLCCMCSGGKSCKMSSLYYSHALELLCVLLGWCQRAGTERPTPVRNIPSASRTCVTGHGI